MRVGHGFDAHRLVAGRTLILGGVDVPADAGALGHSDADVLAHALGDAILGAAALGDLGAHFPDTDPRWQDANSMDLLAQCAMEARKFGYRVVNVDATIVLQAPKLAAHIGAMRDNVAGSLGIGVAQVSVKAKTTEGLGFTGDGTGIAAFAVALLENA